MPAYGFGDIVRVPFPFTDQSGAKKRSAIVVSSAAYNEARRDMMIMAVTSHDQIIGDLRGSDNRRLVAGLDDHPRFRRGAIIFSGYFLL